MSRRAGGPSAQQQPRMNYQSGGYHSASYQPQSLNIRAIGAQAAQNQYFQRQPMRMASQSSRGQQPMQFQQPPPAPGPTQQQQPQAQVQQQNLGARGFVPPQNVHQMVFMTTPTYRMPAGMHGVQIYPQPQQFPSFGTAAQYQIPGAYNQPPPNIPNQPASGHPRPQTPPTQGMPGAGGPAGPHPGMNPMMPAYLSASQPAASGHHSLPPNTHSQPPPPHMQPGHAGMPPSVSINQPQMATISAPKPYEKRKRQPLLIVNPDTQEVVNPTEQASASSISETASEANSEVSEAKAEELAETASTEVAKEEETKEAATESASETNTEAAAAEVVLEPSEIHPESSSNENDQVLEQTVEHNDVEGKSKTKKKDAKVEKEAEKAAPEEEPTGTPEAAKTVEQTEVANAEQAEVVDGNCVSSSTTAEQNNHVEQPVANHVGNSEEEKETLSGSARTSEEKEQNDSTTTTNSEEAVENLENGTASSSANNSNSASKSSSLIKLKYEYPEDQWSPINKEGKKQYDRDFLVKLAKDPLSLRKPDNLPAMDIIRDRANAGNNRMPMVNASKDWTPGFVKPTPSKSGRDRPAGPAGRRDGKPAPAVIDLKISDRDITLQKAENAWKPQNKLDGNEVTDPLAELERNVRSILNKLTPQKFETLVEKFNGLPIDTQEKLKACIELIFEKAVDEPEFSVAYARMCEVLREKEVKDGGSANFRKLLIARCQKEFERDYMEGFDKAKYEAELAAAESEDKRKALQAEFEEKERRARRRSLGNIRFIGELYNLKMLTDRIMHEIINKLIQQIDEESLECLCWLLTTIGKALEHATNAKLNAPASDPESFKHKQNLKPFDYYFKQMEDITKKKKVLPSRVRFMLQDVIDLRRNEWRPRREKAGPKKIDDIHKDAEREKTQAKLMEMAGPNVSGGGGGGGGNQNNRGDRDNRGKRSSRGPQQSMENTDEWNTVAYSGRSKGYDRNDAQKIQNLADKITTKTQDSSNMSLGPSSGYLNRGWGKGSGSAPKPPQQNRFSAIQNSDTEGQTRRNFSASMGNFNRSSHSRGSSVDPDRAGALEAVKQLSAVTSNGPHPAQGHKDSKAERGGPGGGPPAPSQAGLPQVGGPSMSVDLGHMAHMTAPQTMDESKLMVEQTKVLKGAQDQPDDLIQRRVKGTLEEYLSLKDKESAFQDVCSHFHPNHMSRVAEEMISYAIENKPDKMKLTGELLDSLVMKHALLPTQLQNAFNQLLQISTDLEVDIPKLWDNIAMVLAPSLASERSLSMKYLLEAKQFLEPQQVPKFLSGVLLQLAEAKGRPKAGDMMKKSELSLSDFMPSDQVPTFLISHKLEFIESPSNSTKDLIKYNVTKLLQENPQKYDAVFSWIEEHITEEDRTTKPKDFIRTLTVVLTEGSINEKSKNEKTLNETEFTNRCSVLKRYVDANIDREKQVLYALQHLMHTLEHPNKLLFNIFNALYNNDVISEEGFEAWLACSDSAEQEGKGVASKSTTHFFTWMRENDDNEGEDEE